MQTQLSVNGLAELTDWHAINWKKAYRMLKNLRGRIFRAAKEGDHKKVRSLQRLMMRSYANIAISVRKVTQSNKGRSTPGIDNLTVTTAKGRAQMVEGLIKLKPWKAKPTRRIYIRKTNGKQRPLGIPVIKDRCLQAMVVNALEPEWESRFEASSYGFRPGRGCHDAIARIFNLANPTGIKRWIIDADIKGAFDNIDHNFILDTIENFPSKHLIQQWLKAGYMDKNVFYTTEQGTPQGGICSPLLANIALHGMEEALGIGYRKGFRSTGELSLVKYADDFVIFCPSRDKAIQTIAVLKEWLKKRGLQLSEEKTRIVHITEGFDFLGFNIRQYPSKVKRLKSILLIRPSKESVQKIRNKIKAIWLANKTTPVKMLVSMLNPVIRGWANYFRIGVAKKIFSDLDRWMFYRAWRHAKRKHPNKNTTWRVTKYWGQLNLDRKDNWVFGDKKTGDYLQKFQWIKIQRHIMVKGTYSPDDPSLKEYWKKRTRVKIKELVPSKQKIAKKQNFICPVCNQILLNGEELHIHHILPVAEGGKDKYRNLILLHQDCHTQIHSNAYRTLAIQKGLLAVSRLLEPDVM
jgi:RNA-directed DNA polymerase